MGQGAALVGASLIGTTALLSQPDYRTLGIWALVGMGAGLVVASLPPVLRRVTRLWFRLARQDPPPGGEPGPGFALRWVALYTVNWGIYALSFWILVKSFDLAGGPAQVGPAFAAAYVIGYVAIFALAGLGVRESFLILFLSPFMGAAAAGAVAVIARLWTTAVEVIPAGAFWLRHVALARKGRGP
jgi:uncharacterized membrane protein YbhN (UPF0104 family)